MRIATIVLLAAASEVHAACAQCYEWAAAPLHSGPPTSPVYVGGHVLVTVDGEIYLLRSGDGTRAARHPTNTTIARTPAYVRLLDAPLDPHDYIFVSQGDGFLVKLAVPDDLSSDTALLQVASTNSAMQARDMRRPACAGDTLIAAPIVQRRAVSNAQFTADRDLVMVPSARACGDTGLNGVVALDAADVTLPPRWVFNAGEYEVGRIRGCLLDLERNLIHCAAEHPAGSTQGGLFAIDTNSGQLAWSALFDAGVHALPVLGATGTPYANRLYVGDTLGRLHSLDAGTGVALASIPTAELGDLSIGIAADLAAGRGLNADKVYVVSASGAVHAFEDNDDMLVEAWRSSLSNPVVTRPLPIPQIGVLYVGTNDGLFRQLDIDSGNEQARAEVGLTSVPSTLDSLALGTYLAPDGSHRIVASLGDPTLGGTTRQWRMPCAIASTTCPSDALLSNGFESATATP